MAAHSAILSIKVLTDAREAARGMEQAATGVDKWKGRLSSAAKVATGVLVGLGAAAFSFGKAAAEDAQGAAVLATALQNSTGATKSQVSAVEDWITKTELATGVADDKLRPALGTLARATGSVEKSQKALSAALDISAATGKDVESVSSAIAKGYAGNTSALGRLVPGLDKAVLASGDMNKIMAELARTTGGSAAAAADTAAGKYARMQVAIQETKESMGAALLPVMASVSGLLAKLATLIQNNTQAFTVIAAVIAAVAAGVVVLNAALKVYQAVTVAVGIVQKATWLANPIGLVVVAIIAVVAAVVLLYRHSKTFREFVDAMWAAIKAGALAVVAAVRPAFAVLFKVLQVYVKVWWTYLQLVFGLIKGAVQLVVAIFKGDWGGALNAVRGMVAAFKAFFVSIFNLLPGPVRSALATVGSIIGGTFRTAKSVVSTIISGIKTLISGIRTTVETVFHGLEAVITDPWHAASDAVQTLIGYVEDLIGWISRIHIPSLPGWMSSIPGLGRSADVPTVPGSRVAGDRALGVLAPRGGGAATATGGGVQIVVNGALDPEAVARQIRAILSGHDRRTGLTARAV